MVIFSIGLFAVPGAFADVTVENAAGSSTPGCEPNCFIPSTVTVSVGEIVTWENTDTAAHTATAGSAADGPSGVFDSSLIMAGGSYSHTFDTAGTYDYHCVVHPWMEGTVIVEDAPQYTVTATAYLNATSPTGRTLSVDHTTYGGFSIWKSGTKVLPTGDECTNGTCFMANHPGDSHHYDFQYSIPEDWVAGTYDVMSAFRPIWEYQFTSTITVPELPEPEAEPAPDTVLPQVLVPDDITIETDNQDGASATFNPQAIDNIDELLTPTCNYTTGSVFPVGTTTVTCTATDAAGNTGFGTFAIIVIYTPPPDTTPPGITVPPNQNFSTSNSTGVMYYHAIINEQWGGGTPIIKATDDVGFQNRINHSSTIVGPASGQDDPFPIFFQCVRSDGISTSQNPEKWTGGTGWYHYPVGTTTVTCTATDSSGNVGTASFTVTVNYTVVDTTPPTISMLSDISDSTSNQDGKIITFTVTASDDVGITSGPTCSPFSGSVFPVGTTTVTCTATDSSGNIASNTFNVIIEYTGSLIPEWVKNVAGFWHDGSINDASFLEGISYLIQNNIIIVPTTESGTGGGEVPEWVKNTAGWWANDEIDNDTFVNAITYLIQQGLIQV